MIETSWKKDMPIGNGDVFYSVKRIKDYGALIRRRLEEYEAGSRIAVDEKKAPYGFCPLERPKEGEPGGPARGGREDRDGT